MLGWGGHDRLRILNDQLRSAYDRLLRPNDQLHEIAVPTTDFRIPRPTPHPQRPTSEFYDRLLRPNDQLHKFALHTKTLKHQKGYRISSR